MTIKLQLPAMLLTCVLLGCDARSLDSLMLPTVDPADQLALFVPDASPTPVQSAGDPVFLDEPIFNEIPGKSGHHAPTITVFPDGELLASWFSFAGPHELDGSAIYMSRKLPGEPWQTPWLHTDHPEGDGNPVLYSEGDHVWFFQAVVPFGWSTANILVQQSDDRGHTWSAAKTLSAWPGSNTRFPPIRLPCGMLLLPAYDDLLSRSLFFISSDGDTWSELSSITTEPACIQPSIVQLDSGQILAVMRNKAAGWLWFSVSDDSGRSWQAPTDSGFPNPASPTALLRLQSGDLAMIFNDSNTTRSPLSISLSADKGRTWPATKVLLSGDDDYAYPAAVQAPDGLIHIVYSVSKQQIRHIVINEVWICSPQTPSE